MDILKNSEERLLRYDFNAVETHDLSMKLANRHREKAAVASDKKAAQAQFDSNLKQIEADIDSLSNKVSSGHEFRKTECRIKYHYPRQGFKQITRLDTNEKLPEEKMTSEEWNLFNQEASENGKESVERDQQLPI